MKLLRNLIAIVLTALVFDAQAAVFKIATISPDGTAWMVAMREGAAEIERRTDGRVRFKFYPGGVMGSDEAVLRKIRIGQLHGGAVTIGDMAAVSPDITIYSLPYLFSSLDQVDYVRSRLDARLMQGLEKAGFVGFGLAEGGFTYMMSDEKLDTIADVRRKKIWIPQGNTVGEAVFKSADISPVQLPVSDVLTGLQTGLVDTVAASPIGAIALQWHTRIRYVVDEPMNYFAAMLVVDKRAYDKLSAEDQAVLREVMSGVYSRIDSQNRKDNQEAREALINQGIVFVPLSPGAQKEWKAVGEKAMRLLEQDNHYSRHLYEDLMRFVAESR